MIIKDQEQIYKRFRDIYDLNIPFAKLINIAVEKKSISLRNLPESISTLNLIEAKTTENYYNVETSVLPYDTENIYDKIELNSTPVNSDSNTNNTKSLAHITENMLKYNENDESFTILPHIPSITSETELPYKTTSSYFLEKVITNSKKLIITTNNYYKVDYLEVSSPTSNPVLNDRLNKEIDDLEDYNKELATNNPVTINDKTTHYDKFNKSRVTLEYSKISNIPPFNIQNIENTTYKITDLITEASSFQKKDNILVNKYEVPVLLDINDAIVKDSIAISTKNDLQWDNRIDKEFNWVEPSIIGNSEVTSEMEEITLSSVGKLEHELKMDNSGIKPLLGNKLKPLTSIPLSDSTEENVTSLHVEILTDPTVNVNDRFAFSNVNSTAISNLNMDSWDKLDNNLPSFINGTGYTVKTISSTIVISLASTLAFILIMFVLVSLFLLKRHKYRSKVFHSFETKSKFYLTKPMRPAILAEEIPTPENENNIKDFFQKPKEPIYLDQELFTCTNQSSNSQTKLSCSIESCDSGIDNIGFTDSSSPDSKVNYIRLEESSSKKTRSLPKYTPKRYKKFPDSVIRVYSSDGSIFPTSPSLTKCMVPPPPYSPCILKCNTNKNLDIDIQKKVLSGLPIDCSIAEESICSISEVCDNLASHSTSAC